MSSWHQRNGSKRPVKLQHETSWTLVTDPPNEMMSVMRFNTKEEAYAAQKTRTHSFVLPPENTHPHYYQARRNSDMKEG